jgi:hypothetical protein
MASSIVKPPKSCDSVKLCISNNDRVNVSEKPSRLERIKSSRASSRNGLKKAIINGHGVRASANDAIRPLPKKNDMRNMMSEEIMALIYSQ